MINQISLKNYYQKNYKKMKIFEFSWNSFGGYGRGIMLIAANSAAEAVDEKDLQSGYWEDCYERTDIQYTGTSKTATVILEEHYQE